LIALVLHAAPILAQEAAPSQSAQSVPVAVDDAIGDIVVTASRIQRSGFTAPTPTTIIGAAAIEGRGATNIGTVLNETPTFKASTNPATTAPRAIFPGAYYADMRGLTASRTLVLVDKNRFVPQITTGLPGYQVDLNQIPTLLLDRVEVVTGGASAQWGSDAVAGVVNLILKKKFEGLEVSGQYGLAEVGDYQEYRLGGIYGVKLGDRTHLEIAGDYIRNKGVHDVYTRDWGRKAYGLLANPCPLNAAVSAACPSGGNGQAQQLLLPDVRYATTTTGGLINSTTGPAAQLRGIFFNPDGSIGRFQYGNYVGSQFMQGGGSNAGYNFNTGVDVIPPVERYIGYARLNQEVGSTFELYAEGSYSHSTGHNLTLPSRNEQTSPIVIRPDNPYIPASLRTEIARLNALPANAANQITTFNLGRNNVDLGYQYSTVKNITYRGVAGFAGKIGDWKIDGAVTYGKNRYLQSVQNDRILARFNYAADAVVGPGGQITCRALVPGSSTYNPTAAAGCVPINLFGFGSPSAQAQAYVNGTLHSSTIYSQTAANLSANGDVFNTWAGPVSVAVGTEYRSEKQVTKVDPIAEMAGYESTNARSLRGTFNVKEVFGEVVVPLAKNWVLLRSLDLQGAARYTDYSTSGSVETWKVGATWTPIPGLLIRAARSRDIRAPNLFELNTPAISTTLNRLFTTGVAGGPAGQVSTENLSGGNAGLRPEKANTTTIGFSYSPPFLPGLQFSVDHYEITVKNAIAVVDAQVIINYCSGGTPTSAEQRNYYCQFVSLAPAGGAAVYRVNNNYLNVNATQRIGWDMEASYRLPLSRVTSTLPGSLTARFTGNYIKHYRDNINGTGYVERAGEVSAAGSPHWLTNSSITYDSDLVTLGVQLRTVGGGKYNNLFTQGVQINNNKVPGVNYVNLSAALRPIKGIEIFGVINNLFDRDPPLEPQNFGFPFIPSWHDPIGRAFRFGVRYRM
jgi:outer membrane receptor protein involved in Fe transport